MTAAGNVEDAVEKLENDDDDCPSFFGRQQQQETLESRTWRVRGGDDPPCNHNNAELRVSRLVERGSVRQGNTKKTKKNQCASRHFSRIPWKPLDSPLSRVSAEGGGGGADSSYKQTPRTGSDASALGPLPNRFSGPTVFGAPHSSGA